MIVLVDRTLLGHSILQGPARTGPQLLNYVRNGKLKPRRKVGRSGTLGTPGRRIGIRRTAISRVAPPRAIAAACVGVNGDASVRRLKGEGRVTPEALDAALRQIRLALLEAVRRVLVSGLGLLGVTRFAELDKSYLHAATATDHRVSIRIHKSSEPSCAPHTAVNW